MALLPVVNDRVAFTSGAAADTDTFRDGLRWGGDRVRAAGQLTTVGYVQGVPVNEDGRVCILDASAGLPAGATFSNGLPISNGQLCISVDAMATYCNGIPMAANGGVCI